jgi:hypothetical protein
MSSGAPGMFMLMDVVMLSLSRVMCDVVVVMMMRDAGVMRR